MIRPVLFNGAMVRAIIARAKRQTRRPVKIPRDVCAECVARSCPHGRGDLMACDGVPNAAGVVFGTTPYLRVPACDHASVQGARVRAPYDVGDTLWVRECFAVMDPKRTDDADLLHEVVRPDGSTAHLFYRATAPHFEWDDEAESKWTPSIHMPRWASRLSLRVTDVRVERVQDISEEDAIAEGVTPRAFGEQPIAGDARGRTHATHPYVAAFAEVWDGIYGDAGWAADPWVWATTFEVIDPT